MSLKLPRDDHAIAYKRLCKITHIPAPQNFITGINLSVDDKVE
jgi:hypothetical protein